MGFFWNWVGGGNSTDNTEEVIKSEISIPG